MPTISTVRFTRLLLTGAAGGLGRELRPRLKAHCDVLRVSDIAPMAPAGAGEEVVQAALGDRDAIAELLRDVQAVVHLGGVSGEAPFAPILDANIVGVFHLYEAARLHGARRVVFASSNHAIGFYRQDEVIDSRVPPRPDTYYGVSKVFGESLSRYYWDRHGIETVCLRIGSSFAQPRDRRMLSTWLSYDDLERLVVASLTAPVVGHTVIYGMSANRTTWWDNRLAAHIGYRPEDSSEPFRAALEAAQPTIDIDDPTEVFQGGAFVRKGPME